MRRLRYWPFVGSLLLVSLAFNLSLTFAHVMKTGAAGVGWLLGSAVGVAAIPALVAVWSFREERGRAPRVPTIIFSVLCAGLVADWWADAARRSGSYGSPDSTALLLAFGVGGGLLAFAVVCILAGLFRGKWTAPPTGRAS